MFGRARIRARQQHAPAGQMREGSPDLLAVDDEAIALKLGPGPQRGQIGAGAGF